MPRFADRPTLRRAAAVAFALALSACAKEPREDDTTAGLAADSAATMPAPGASTAPTPANNATSGAEAVVDDANIFAILTASNQAEIEPSQMARQKAQNAQLKAYAQRMITDHTALQDSGNALAQRIGAAPAEHALSEGIRTQTRATGQKLQGLQGMDFDTAYASAMAMSHQQTLATLQERLIPRAQNPELRAALEQKVRPAVEAHLQEIRQIQSSMGGGGQQ